MQGVSSLPLIYGCFVGVVLLGQFVGATADGAAEVAWAKGGV